MTISSVLSDQEVRDRGLEPVEISVVVPVLDEVDTVGELSRLVSRILDDLGRSFEIIFVDDGSTDGTADRVREVHSKDSRVKLVRLRRNFGKAAALCAGFDASHGRILITMDGDLQDDPAEIPRFLTKLLDEDLDLVSGWKQKRRDPVSKRLPSRLFNWATRRLAQVDQRPGRIEEHRANRKRFGARGISGGRAPRR